MAARESTSTSTELNISIEAMSEHDLLEVCAIEQVSELSAWGWDAYHKELQSAQDTIMLVARIDSAFHGTEIAGFIVARLIADELHVNNVAVRLQFRGYRVGSRLLRTALEQAKHRGASVARLEVRAGNEVAQALYRRCGFEVAGSRKDYYRQPTEDALLMNLSLESSS